MSSENRWPLCLRVQIRDWDWTASEPQAKSHGEWSPCTISTGILKAGCLNEDVSGVECMNVRWKIGVAPTLFTSQVHLANDIPVWRFGILVILFPFCFLSLEFSARNAPICLNGERDQIFIILRLKASAYKLWHWRGKKAELDFVRYYLFQRCMAARGDCQEGKQQQKRRQKINNPQQSPMKNDSVSLNVGGGGGCIWPHKERDINNAFKTLHAVFPQQTQT